MPLAFLRVISRFREMKGATPGKATRARTVH
jgi:hypothetical protein